MSRYKNQNNETILREQETLPRFITAGHNLNNIRHEDDTGLIADTERYYKSFYRRQRMRVRRRD